jgi:hypothetical protein
MVEESRVRGSIVGGLNSTFLTLIPKTNRPRTFDDFHPISLCNLCYKIVSKVIANRLKPLFSRFISPEQLGFLKGRRIQDAIGAASESIHNISKKKIKALVLKLDLQKAYDCIDWSLLRMILHKVGLGIQLTNWIMSCVTSSSFAVLVNGEPSDFFKSERGVRQGCPLSPLLFILMMEGLSLLLKKSAAEGLISGINVSRLTKILHLFFVDDVLIMSKASLEDWKQIKANIELFCNASGLSVSQSKTTVIFDGLNDQELSPFKSLLNFSFSELSEGFKYLGYFIKSGPSRAADWGWLVSKFSQKISGWYNRWLTIGGIYTLIKSILEGQPVFWMSMESLPRSVLNKIRKLIFHYLWNGRSDSCQYHLCRWDLLARPKRNGGWGFRNLSHFNLALNATMLWRLLTHQSIWHQVVMDKYLFSIPLLTWLRQPHFNRRVVSRIWSSLLRSLPIIMHWLCWKPGAGRLIALGRDAILNLGDNVMLSSELVQNLSDKHYTSLAHVSNNIDPTSLAAAWKTSFDLNLTGAQALEWTSFTAELNKAGIYLSEDQADCLLWSGGDGSGTFSVKNCYNAIISSHNLPVIQGWKLSLWKHRVQLKIILFFWLAVENRILTWDILQAKGWIGPGLCILCKHNVEDNPHLFIHCPYTKEVWFYCLQVLNFRTQWFGNTLNECMDEWNNRPDLSKNLPLLVCWHIWLDRNNFLFEGKIPSARVTALKVLSTLGSIYTTEKVQFKSCSF